MSKLFVLFEHAAGYAVFAVKEFEEVGMLLPQVEASVTDISRFNTVVKLIGFSPFKTALAALENINNVSEGVVPEDLQLFLDSCIPKAGKKEKVVLGVADPKLGASITEALNIKCDHTGAIPEIIRGIRFHFHNLVKGFTVKSSGVAQLGLGHSYSRAKVKFNVNRVDNMIIQSIALLDQLDKDVNTFSMRIREWYSYHFPELVKIVPENYMYAKVAQLIKNRKELTEEKLEALEEVVMDSVKAQAIIDASKSSMGMDISPVDLLNIEMFAARVIALADYRKQLAEYLRSKMAGVAPNLATLIGDQVGARLIAHAGSLTNLAKYPASTVQILGAEKALFRALKTRGNTPKYGLLFHSTFIGRAGTKNKGRISRYLANKCSIASRIDCFTEIPTNVFGEKLRQQVEDRLKFYETGEIPKKNIDVMKEALLEASQIIANIEEESPKKKKKKLKRKRSETVENGTENGFTENGVQDESEEPVKKKKKKKKSKSLAEDE
ncbi:nucleolar protein 56 [Hylaeus anthracinus]|uniref:nucleolar protein 56 n=1 Tax=Hylaeus volcanicus TaxID=313075 RepID=UPI0023B8479B|nr:nucleolar protein 56 [Hylaeus volcanicus]XP_053991652.1 nucleolar protein 56 [Hylaeus volcanicus]XP_054005293.1 nucleolar protein 56 [Hylaeus anthracinus]XP_054005294.1 nucleolar protein 56 [Hylaeus anthracinus]